MSASAQHRCVFVGNIPYDVTEEQLTEICREVGPVVSFRLVVDRDTLRPKGYGFCEYKDEETALSARRNLQGYEINGRQLRVDFAENDKGGDKNREQVQGRGGPGISANVDAQKQLVGTGTDGGSVMHQPIGLHIALNAATVMARALGGAQTSFQANESGIQSHLPANDPLTLYLAKMSTVQLNQIISDLKTMATQNKEQAHQLLLARPQLAKAFFQAQIMLGMVTPEVLQMPNLLQAPSQSANSSFLEGQIRGQPTSESSPQIRPSLSNIQSRMMPNMPEGQTSLAPHSRFSGSQNFVPQHATTSFLQESSLPGQPRVSVQTNNTRQQIQGISSSLNQQMPQHLGHKAIHSSVLPRTSNAADFQKTGTYYDASEVTTQPSKLIKLEDGSGASSSIGGLKTVPINPVVKAENEHYSAKQTAQVPPEIESALLEQVMKLTPEQLSLLPIEQQQQVIQLQQALRRDKTQVRC